MPPDRGTVKRAGKLQSHKGDKQRPDGDISKDAAARSLKSTNSGVEAAAAGDAVPGRSLKSINSGRFTVPVAAANVRSLKSTNNGRDTKHTGSSSMASRSLKSTSSGHDVRARDTTTPSRSIKSTNSGHDVRARDTATPSRLLKSTNSGHDVRARDTATPSRSLKSTNSGQDVRPRDISTTPSRSLKFTNRGLDATPGGRSQKTVNNSHDMTPSGRPVKALRATNSSRDVAHMSEVKRSDKGTTDSTGKGTSRKSSSSSLLKMQRSGEAKTSPPTTPPTLSRRSRSTSKSNTKLAASGWRDHSQEKTSATSLSSGHSSTEVMHPTRLGRDRTRTRTLSPHEVKMSRNKTVVLAAAPGDKRDRRKSSPPASPPPPTSSPPPVSPPPSSPLSSLLPEDSMKDVLTSLDTTEAEDDYEDDFEEYESDFEEVTESVLTNEEEEEDNDDATTGSDMESDIGELSSRPVVEEEKKLDSGNYDLTENKRKGQQEMEEIVRALHRENAAIPAISQLHQSVAKDEGYEEGRADERGAPQPLPTGFIDFTSAKKRMQERMVTAKVKKRGEELLDMIRLDVMAFTLFDLAPLPYEAYMKSYGKSNATQAYVQTNEDNLSEETQTEEITRINKWTQKPVTYRTARTGDTSQRANDPLMIFSQDRLGVGGEGPNGDPNFWEKRVKVDLQRLTDFISSAGQVMLQLLEARKNNKHGDLTNVIENGLPFTDGFIGLVVDMAVPFLAGRPITLMRFPPHSPLTLVTVHPAVQTEDGGNGDNVMMAHCMVCVWNTLEPSRVQHILVASEEVTAMCFAPHDALLVCAGLRDGSVCVWDLRELSTNHHKFPWNDNEWILRSPTYSTAEILKSEAHLSTVVAVQPLMDASTDHHDYLDKSSPLQVCSLEEAGTIMVWTMLRTVEHTHLSKVAQDDLGLAHWGNIRLTRTFVINLHNYIDVGSNLQCVDLKLDGSHLYVSTNTGHVIHCMRDGARSKPFLYQLPSGVFASANCVEVCPFGLPYFLVGSDDGSVRLYSRRSERVLTTFAVPDSSSSGVRALHWLSSRPTLFFVVDSDCRMHLWDLSMSDMCPVQSTTLSTTGALVKLSPEPGDAKGCQYMALTTHQGIVQVHTMKAEYLRRPPSEFQLEVEQFAQYAAAL